MAADATSTKMEMKAYRKFLVQRTILDSFRLYLTMSDEFIRRIEEEKLLTNEELYLIKELSWPSNRNEFLKVVVRKSWTKEEFDMFNEILRETQHVKLSAEISERSQDFLENAKAEDTSLLIKDPERAAVLEGPLTSLPMHTKNHVLALLRDKDDKIYQLQKDSERLQARVSALVAENDGLRRQLHTLDKEVTKTLHEIGVESDKGHQSSEHGMAELRDRFVRQTTTIQCLKQEKQQQEAEKQIMKEKLSVVIEEGIKLRKINQDWARSYKDLKANSEAEIAQLRVKVSSQNEKLDGIQHKHSDLDTRFSSTSHAYEQQLAEFRSKLATVSGRLEQAIMTRDRAISELLKMKDDSRKLLKSLELDNGIKGTTLSHARNIAHVKKRQGQKVIASQNTSNVMLQLSTISEEDKAMLAKTTDPNHLPVIDTNPRTPNSTPQNLCPSPRLKPRPFLHSGSSGRGSSQPMGPGNKYSYNRHQRSGDKNQEQLAA